VPEPAGPRWTHRRRRHIDAALLDAGHSELGARANPTGFPHGVGPGAAGS
jgi:hypothetical protein